MKLSKRILLLVGLLSANPTFTMAFAPLALSTMASKVSSTVSKYQHNMIDPDQISGFSDLANHLDLSSQFLADAAANTAGKDLGWWGSYINFFKLALSAVHGVVDGPLKSVGIEESWGVSIALFTCRKFVYQRRHAVDHYDRSTLLTPPFLLLQLLGVFCFLCRSSNHKVLNT